MNSIAIIGQSVISLLGAGTIGALASGGLNRWLATRDARRKQLRRLLTDLLELRNVLVAMGQIRQKLAEIIPEQKNQIAILTPQLLGVFTNTRQLHERYDSAVSELACIDPLLAYRLRSKNLIEHGINVLAHIPIQDQNAVPFAATALEFLGEAGRTGLDESIILVSKSLGRKVVRGSKDILQKQLETPPEADKFLQFIQSSAAHLTASAASRQSNPSSGSKQPT